MEVVNKKMESAVAMTNYISRDLSWVNFNRRVLDQAANNKRNLLERLKFLAITSSNLDEFFQIRVGSLYNYIDYNKERVDYSGLKENQFRKTLLKEVQDFYKDQQELYAKQLEPEFLKYKIQLVKSQDTLTESEKDNVYAFFKKTIFPMLTPMTYDSYHSFPIMMNKLLVFGVVSINTKIIGDQKRLTFIQIPQNLPRFYEIKKDDMLLVIPIQEIIRWHIQKLFRNVELQSVSLFRITRNGDFLVEESDDIDEEFIDEIKKKIKTRRTARVVRLEIEDNASNWMLQILQERYNIDDYNIFLNHTLLDFTCFWQLVNHDEFKDYQFKAGQSVRPLGLTSADLDKDRFELVQEKDVFLHQPFNDFNFVVEMLEQAAEDPNVLAIKMTIYRLAKNSRITNALLKAAENGKHVSVLFEVKARFDEENNIKEGQRLQKAGCFVIYGVSRYKTHTKLLLIVRKNPDESITRFVHLSSGNYNETTSKIYTDVSLLSTREEYAEDISEFFNVITGHSDPNVYKNIITAPGNMRTGLIELIRNEAANAMAGKPSGIVIKINSLQDKESIDALYEASKAGVTIKLIVRGMCCLKPQVAGLSENITVRSIIGDFLEHTRIYYFQNAGEPLVYSGSADMMVRSFDRRIESLFKIVDPIAQKTAMHILHVNLNDNVNSYELHADETYTKVPVGAVEVDSHKDFYHTSVEEVMSISLF
ncbi:MAG: polyphosphate kinase 1 [Cytophagaceae bacterium]